MYVAGTQAWACTHTDTHTCAHTHRHTHVCSHTQTHTHALTHTDTHTCALTHTHLIQLTYIYVLYVNIICTYVFTYVRTVDPSMYCTCVDPHTELPSYTTYRKQLALSVYVVKSMYLCITYVHHRFLHYHSLCNHGNTCMSHRGK